MSARDLLHLLCTYQTIIASRPIERGNREFLAMLVRSSEALGSALASDSTITPAIRATLAAALARVRAQTVENAAALARATVPTLRDVLRVMRGGIGTDSIYVRRPIAISDREYTEISIVCGPGLGMGDEISFLQLFRALGARYPGASLTIFNLYPGLWGQLIPSARQVHYRGRPVRPIEHINQRRRADVTQRSLVVVVDFDAYNLHEVVIQKHVRQDILEISLGLRIVWFARGDSCYVDVEQMERLTDYNNYVFVHALARRVLGTQAKQAVWAGVQSTRPPSRRQAMILVNALSSKSVPLSLADWRAAFGAARAALDEGRELHAVIYPGLHAASQQDAHTLQSALASERITSSVLSAPRDRPLTPFNAVDVLVSLLRRIDICLTIDTFTAHLVPLFGVPTLVIALKQNREFWVPAPHAYYCLIEDFVREVPEFVGRILRNKTALASLAPSRRSAARAVAEATERLRHDGGSSASIETVCAKLAAYLMHTNGDTARAGEARQWLRYWSRLTTATRREPLAPDHVSPLIQQWEVSEFFKRVALDA